MLAKITTHPEGTTTTHTVESYGHANEIAAQASSDYPGVEAVTVCVWDDDANPTTADPEYTCELSPTDLTEGGN